MEELCFLRRPCRDVISKGQSQLRVTSVRESVKRGHEPEAEELPLLEPLPGTSSNKTENTRLSALVDCKM
jgi:hypothetical protein